MAQTRRRPNILMFVADDQRHDTIGALNNPDVRTPTMDYLAERGTVMTDMHLMGSMCDAVCMPSRAMVHTGRTLFHIKGNGDEIPRSHVTLGEHLRRNGYITFGTGKWHNDPDSFARSFGDGATIFFGGMDDHWNMPVCRYHREGEFPEPTGHPWNPGYGEAKKIDKRFDYVAHGTHATTLFAHSARDFLLERGRNRPSTQPFFCYCAFTAPHDPRTMPIRFRTMFPKGGVSLPPNLVDKHPFDNGAMDIRDEYLASLPRDPSEIEGHIRDYYAMIAHMDSEIGAVLDALEATGEIEDTLIVWTADHGLAVGQHGLLGKQNLYDHSCRVPFVIAGPGVRQGSIRSHYTYLLDVFPTLCELVDLPIPESVEGTSFLPSLRDDGVPHRDHLFLAFGTTQRALKKDGFKLVEYCVNDRRHTQLFDLSSDPWEQRSEHDKPERRTLIEALRMTLTEASAAADDTVTPFWTTG